MANSFQSALPSLPIIKIEIPIEAFNLPFAVVVKRHHALGVVSREHPLFPSESLTALCFKLWNRNERGSVPLVSALAYMLLKPLAGKVLAASSVPGRSLSVGRAL